MKTFILSVICLVAISSLNAQKVVLKKGDQYKMVSETKMTMKQEVMGQSMEIPVLMNDTKLIEVTGFENNTYSITSKIAALKTSVSMMGQEIKYDSENPGALTGPGAENFEAMMKYVVKLVLGEDGNIIKFEDNKDEIGEASQAMGMIGEGDAQKEYEVVFLPLAGKKVKTGDTWNKDIKNDEVNMTVKYTVKSVSGNTVAITILSEGDVEKTTEANGMEVLTKMKMKSTSDNNYDTNTGILISGNMTVSGEGTSEVSGMSIPMTMEITKTVAVTKK